MDMIFNKSKKPLFKYRGFLQFSLLQSVNFFYYAGIDIYMTTQILHKKIIATEQCPAYIPAVQEFLIMYLFEELSLIFPALPDIPV